MAWTENRIDIPYMPRVTRAKNTNRTPSNRNGYDVRAGPLELLLKALPVAPRHLD